MKVRCEYEDGQYWLTPWTEKHGEAGLTPTIISPFSWLWYRFVCWLSVRNGRWIAGLDNDQWYRDRPNEAPGSAALAPEPRDD